MKFLTKLFGSKKQPVDVGLIYITRNGTLVAELKFETKPEVLDDQMSRIYAAMRGIGGAFEVLDRGRSFIDAELSPDADAVGVVDLVDDIVFNSYPTLAAQV